MAEQPIPEKFPQQLRIAIQFALTGGTITPAGERFPLTPEDKEILGVKEGEDAAYAVGEVLYETLMTLVTEMQIQRQAADPRQTQQQLQASAYGLLQLIANSNGLLRSDNEQLVALKLPDEFISTLVQEGVIEKRWNGLAWGRNARRAMDQFESRRL